MSAPIDDGGPAFPRPGSNWDEGPYSRKYDPAVRGMSLRDWFAGQALAALVQKRPLLDREGVHGPKFTDADLVVFNRDMAITAYQYADAMLAERKRGGAS